MHILVVGGSEEHRASIKSMLERGHYTVSLAESAEEAYSQISVNEYDLIIIDLLLPDARAVDICKSMRSDGISVPIVLLTARTDVATRVSALDSGADDFVLKPVHSNELLARVRAMLRRERTYIDAIINVRDVILDTQRYIVSRAGSEIALTVKEFKLLNYMMRRPGQLCTKSMLEEHVWGHYHLRSSNVIEVTMSRLRKKLNIPGLSDFIVTRRGIGYFIEDKEPRE